MYPYPFSKERGHEENAGIFSNKGYTYSITGWLIFFLISTVITRDGTATKPVGKLRYCYSVLNREKEE